MVNVSNVFSRKEKLLNKIDFVKNWKIRLDCLEFIIFCKLIFLVWLVECVVDRLMKLIVVMIKMKSVIFLNSYINWIFLYLSWLWILLEVKWIFEIGCNWKFLFFRN